MNIKSNKKVLNEAINKGCKTAAQLALFLRNRANIENEKLNR